MRRAALVGVICAFLAVVAPFASTSAATTKGPTAAKGYTLQVWSTGASPISNPDDITTDGRHVYVAFQNTTVTDGSQPGSSTVIQYGLDGTKLQSYPVLGHVDGLRWNSVTHRLWATANEDANALLTVIKVENGYERVYPLPSVNGGGFDDVAFTPFGAIVSASNPATNTVGVNTHPALVNVQLRGNGTVRMTPVLYGNAVATDRTTGRRVTLNLTDPDSLSINPLGDVVLDSQADSELVFLRLCLLPVAQHCKKGTFVGRPSRVLLQPRMGGGPMVDDTAWSYRSAHGLLITDHNSPGTIYVLRKIGGFPRAAAYTTPFTNVATLNTKTGVTTNVATGFSAPKGLLFLP